MRRIFYMMLICLTSYSFGQSSNEFIPQNIDVPNPEVYSFLKNNIWSNTMTSGLLNLNLPLHTIKLDNKDLSIGLSYTSSTPNIIEKGGVLGLGWTMTNNFKITRVKNQIPDDSPHGFIHEEINTVKYVNSNCQNLNSNCLLAEGLYDEGRLDLESDRYIVNLPFGNRSEFMFNQERSESFPYGKIIKFPYDKDLIINPVFEGYKIVGWLVTDKLGYSYEFSQGDEYLDILNYSHSDNGNLGVESRQNNDNYINSWVLTKINSPNNNFIEFDYSSHSYEDCEFVNQKKILATGLIKTNTINTNFQKNKGRFMRLDKISNNNETIVFEYDNKVGDSDYYKMENIIVSDHTKNNTKVYELDYYITNSHFDGEIYGCNAPIDNNTINFRYFLKSIKEKDISRNIFMERNHFQYYAVSDNSKNLPHRFSFAQDWWGKYNGANANKVLVFPFNSQVTHIDGPNRKVNERYSKIGLLKSVLNNLKGKETFFYEQNKGLYSEEFFESIVPVNDRNIFFNSQFDQNNIIDNDDCNRCETFQIPFHINNNVKVQLESNGYGNQLSEVINLKMLGETSACHYDGDLPFDNSCAVWFRILEEGNVRLDWKLLKNEDDRTFPIVYERNTNAPLVHDHQYILEVKIDKGRANALGNHIFDMVNDYAKIKLTYKEIDSEVEKLENGKFIMPVGDTRLNYTESTYNNNLIRKKQYEYKLHNGKDAGIANFKLNYESIALKGKIWSVSSNNNFPLVTSSNSPIFYTNIIEKNISTNSNQKSINTVYTYSFTPSTTHGECYYVGKSIYMSSSPCFKNPRNGKLLILKEEINNNKSHGDTLTVRKKTIAYNNFMNPFGNTIEQQFIEGIDYDRHISMFETGFFEAITNSAHAKIYDFYYKIYSFPDTKKKKTITSYHYDKPLSAITLTNEFLYNPNEVSYEPKMIISNSSNSQNTHQKLHYPQDLLIEGIQPQIMQALIDENRIAQPIKIESFQDNTKIGETYSYYDRNLTTSNLLLPTRQYNVKGDKQIAPSFDEENLDVTYDKYDSYGNILQYTTKEGIPVSIIWGYKHQYPIAKIEGSTYDDVQSYVENLHRLANQDTSANAENLLRAELQKLREARPDSFVTSYTYDPLIGVTSITSPNGQTIYYKYDSFGRLEVVLDEAGNKVKELEYNYKK